MSEIRDGSFPTTHWTLISRLKSGDEKESHRALNELCTEYHYPLYCYIRRRGIAHHDAEDILHDFLAKLLRLDVFEGIDPDRGRLRGFLAVALQRFLSNWQSQSSRRRQDKQVSFDADTSFSLNQAEQRYVRERYTESDTPERVFERQWARELLNRVLVRLQQRYSDLGNQKLFQALQPSLLNGGSLRGEQSEVLAARLGMTPGALRVAQTRFLSAYREILESEVAQTVDHPSDVKLEIDYLLRLFSKS